MEKLESGTTVRARNGQTHEVVEQDGMRLKCKDGDFRADGVTAIVNGKAMFWAPDFERWIQAPETTDEAPAPGSLGALLTDIVTVTTALSGADKALDAFARILNRMAEQMPNSGQ